MDRRSWPAALIAARVGCRGGWPWSIFCRKPSSSKCARAQLSAHVAMKFLVPVARVSLDDCERMAAAVRSASLQYAASRATVCRLARRLAPDPPTSSRPTRVVFQNPAARRTADSPRRGRRPAARSGHGDRDFEPRPATTGGRGRPPPWTPTNARPCAGRSNTSASN